MRVDVRIVGATNADLLAMAEAGVFKRDLLDRLSFEVLFLPPLRARQEDTLILANHFARHMAFELGRDHAPEFTAAVEDALEGHAWPGNVRELKNVVERAVYRTEGDLIAEITLDPFDSPYALGAAAEAAAGPVTETAATEAAAEEAAAGKGALSSGAVSFKEAVLEFERGLVQDALSRARFNQRKAAELLGLSYHQFRGLYRKHAGFR